MSRLDRYYIPPGVPARPPAPPLPRKGILLMPPPPPPQLMGQPSIFSPDIGKPPPSQQNWTYQLYQPIGPNGGNGPQSLVLDNKIRAVSAERGVVGHLRPLPRPAGRYNCYEELQQQQPHPKMMDSQNLAAAMSLPDTSPRLALQRLLMLYENGEHREAAAFLRRLSFPTFRQLLPQLPADVFVESMPHSLPILEALYAKLCLSPQQNKEMLFQQPQALRPEAVVWQLVKFFAGHEETNNNVRWEFCGPFISSCKRLLSALLTAEPKLRRLVTERKRALMKAIEGLGQHGLIGTSDEQLINLHGALKQEFEKAQKAYVEGMNKLEALSLLKKEGEKNKNSSAAPIAQSHQRQLSLKAGEIQERLIKNKTLLNVVEPTLENTSLEVLLGILQQRIELDKECLFQYTQIKKDALKMINSKGKSENESVAPVLMRFQRGCQQVLDLFKELSTDGVPRSNNSYEAGLLSSEDEDGSGSNGYHSDSESCVMTSGNSPFISKEARYNFLSRSVRLGSKHNLRASILASSLCLDSASLRNGCSINGSLKNGSIAGSIACSHSSRKNNMDNSLVIHSSSGVSSGSSDTASNEGKGDKPDSVGTTTTQQQLSRPRHLKQRPKEAVTQYKGVPNLVCSVSSEDSSSEPIYQGILERDISVLRKEAEIAALRKELTNCRGELARAQKTVFAIEDSERALKERLAEERHKTLTLERMCGRGNAYGSLDQRPSQLVRRYGELYSQVRLETLDELDKMPELVNSEELKNKLLFSVVVLAFRSVTSSIETKREQIRRILQLPPPAPPLSNNNISNNNNTPHEVEPAARDLEDAITSYLRRATENFDLTKNVEEVLSQIWATLYDYPCLKTCDGIVKYVKECVRVAWGLVNQTPSYVIEYETRQFRSDLHVRFHTSSGGGNRSNDREVIQTYLWPALLEGEEGPCVQKGVIVT